MTTQAAASRVALRHELRASARAAWEAGLRAVDPRACVSRDLRLDGARLQARGIGLDDVADVVILGWGKAGVSMLRGALEVLGDRVVRGLVVVKDRHDEGLSQLGPVRIEQAAHPVPDLRCERLAREMLALAATVSDDETALVLGSGGGSSLLACPAGALSLDDLASVTRTLLTSGADIHEINAVRKHLSAIHGGRLAVALGRSRSLTLLMSDVVGDDPSSISSGPTARDATTFATARAILARRLRSEQVPVAVARHLEAGSRAETPETPGADDLDWSRHRSVVIASIADAAAAARVELSARGFDVVDLGSVLTGEASDVARSHVARALDARPGAGARMAFVGGGETTVTVRGAGLGGRNQHLACVAARELNAAATTGRLAAHDIVLASIATDGGDGEGGAAGGLVDPGTWRRAIDAGADPAALLDRFDSHALLAAASDLVVTGPTGTNVMDLHLVLLAPIAEASPEAIA